MAQPSPWQSYLASVVGSRGTAQQSKPSVILPYIAGAEAAPGSREEVAEEEKRGLPTKLAAGFLGATAAVAKPAINSIATAVGLVGRFFNSTAKEISDAMIKVSPKIDPVFAALPGGSAKLDNLADRLEAAKRQEFDQSFAEGSNYNYTPSVYDWIRQIREPLYSQDIFPALAYDENASAAEKSLKEIAGFAIDIRAAGGFRGGIRTTGTLGRKNANALMRNEAQLAYKTINAGRMPEDELLEAAVDFGQRAAIALDTGRSGAVRKLFEREFGLEQGRSAFLKQLDPQLQGGVRIIGTKRDLGETTLGSKLFGEAEVVRAYNAGGLTTEKILTRLGLGNLVDEPQKAVDMLMKLKNAARGDVLTTTQTRVLGAGAGLAVGAAAAQGTENPLLGLGVIGTGGAVGAKVGLAPAVRLINLALNNIGKESATWGSYVRAAAGDDHKEIQRMYKNYYDLAPATRSVKESQTEILRDSKSIIDDLQRLQDINPTRYEQVSKLLANPREIKRLRKEAASLTVEELDLLHVAERHQSDFARLRLLLVAEGTDVGLQENYLPLIMKRADTEIEPKGKAANKVKQVRSTGFNFTLPREAYLDEDGIPLLPYEVRDKLLALGRKDLADQIELDPVNQLATYALSVSKMIAEKRTIKQVLAKGGVFRTDIAQLNVNPAQLDAVLSGLTPTQMEKIFTDQLSEPGQLYKFFTDLNDELRDAFAAGDQASINAVVTKVEMFRTAIGQSRKVFVKREEKLKALIQEAKDQGRLDDAEALGLSVAKLNEDQKLAELTFRSLGIAGKGKVSKTVAETNPLLTTIAETLPAGTYSRVGVDPKTGKSLSGVPEELQDLIGEKELVEAFERTFLFSQPGYANKVNMVVDEFNNFFRAAATFGKGPGFGLRNGVSAVQSNMMIANSEASDFGHGGLVVKTLLWTERGLAPFRVLKDADLASKRVDRMAEAGKLTDDQVNRMKRDLRVYNFISDDTLKSLHEEILESKLSKIKLDDGLTGWDTYTTMKRGGVFDDFVIFQGMPNEEFYDDSVLLLGLDPSKAQVNATKIKSKAKQKLINFAGEDTLNRFTVNASRRGEDRTYRQRVLEGVLNAGWDIEVIESLGARPIKIRPIQNSRDFNRIIEYYNRAVPIATGLRRYGGTVEGQDNAVILMKAAQFDYANLTDLEREKIRRWAMPFWTWSRNNVPAMLRASFNDPQRVANNLRGWDLVKELLTDEKGDVYFLPDYVTEMNGFLLDEDIRKDLLEDPPAWLENALGGKLLEFGQALSAYPIAIRPETPVGDLVKLGKVVTDPEDFLKQTVAGSNPVAKAIAQIGFQKNVFSGKNYDKKIGTPAPWWVEKLSEAMTAVNPEWELGFKDSQTGQLMMDEGLLDGIKAIIPLVGSTERTVLPAIEILTEMVTGKPSDLSGSQGDRALTNLVSAVLGINAYTIAPSTEISSLKDNWRRYDTYVRHTAGKYDIDRIKLVDLTRAILRNNPGIAEEDLFTILEEARQSGQLAPDYLSEPAQ